MSSRGCCRLPRRIATTQTSEIGRTYTGDYSRLTPPRRRCVVVRYLREQAGTNDSPSCSLRDHLSACRRQRFLPRSWKNSLARFQVWPVCTINPQQRSLAKVASVRKRWPNAQPSELIYYSHIVSANTNFQTGRRSLKRESPSNCRSGSTGREPARL